MQVHFAVSQYLWGKAVICQIFVIWGQTQANSNQETSDNESIFQQFLKFVKNMWPFATLNYQAPYVHLQPSVIIHLLLSNHWRLLFSVSPEHKYFKQFAWISSRQQEVSGRGNHTTFYREICSLCVCTSTKLLLLGEHERGASKAVRIPQWIFAPFSGKIPPGKRGIRIPIKFDSWWRQWRAAREGGRAEGNCLPVTR